MADPVQNGTPETWWTNLRWVIACRLIRLGMRIAPEGWAAGHLGDHMSQWARDVDRAWNARRSKA